MVTMEEEGTNNPGTIRPETLEDHAKLIVEEGRVYLPSEDTGEMKEGKEYVLRKERNQENPVTIGREEPSSLRLWIQGKKGRKDILLDRKYGYASREHCEIFYDEDKNAYFLVDYSLNGTLVNGYKVGGNRVRETRRLEHGDLIEIPAVGERIKMTFLMYKR